MFTLLSGERIAKRILSEVKRKGAGKKLVLAVVQVGDNKVSEKYVGEKRKAAREIGVGFRFVQLPSSVSQATLEQQVKKLGASSNISGILVQLPLPKRLNTQKVLEHVPQEKDVDVLSSGAFAQFALGTLPILPPTVRAISLLLSKTGKKLQGTRVAVVGAGKLVGLPVSLWLAQQGAKVSLVQKETRNAKSIISKADVVISGVGKPGLLTGSMLKKGAVVIDAGTSVERGSTKGDVDFESVAKKASYLTPVPGGVGPLTVACLFYNLVFLAGNE